jgi:hypothetical protein
MDKAYMALIYIKSGPSVPDIPTPGIWHPVAGLGGKFWFHTHEGAEARVQELTRTHEAHYTILEVELPEHPETAYPGAPR